MYLYYVRVPQVPDPVKAVREVLILLQQHPWPLAPDPPTDDGSPTTVRTKMFFSVIGDRSAVNAIFPLPALSPTGPVVGHPIRPRRLHAPFHQEIKSGGEILLRADGRPASATRCHPDDPRLACLGSTCRPRATLPGAAGPLGRRRPGKPRRDPWPSCLQGS